MSTQHTDRELLELAARAYGLGDDWAYCAEHDAMCQYDSGVNKFWGYARWNPRDDDGDALRLAVRLGICLEFGDCADDSPVVWCGPGADRRDWPMTPLAPDSLAATRRAIVYAAAAIGEAMP